MKTLAGFLSIALFACTAQVSSGPGASRPVPPPPRSEPGLPPPPPVAPSNEGWTELAAPQFNEDFRDFIKPDPTQAYKKFRLDVTRGRVLVDQVSFEFADGAPGQKNKLGRELGAGESLVIDLDGRERQIKRIIVYVDPAQARRDRGMYRLYAR